MPLKVDIRPPAEPRALAATLTGLTALNELLFDVYRRNGHPLPSLYDTDVKYQREDGTERWLDVGEVLKGGEGDCEDLATYRAAELRDAGEPAYVDVVPAQSGRGYHAIVIRADGSVEDPSRVLLDRQSMKRGRNMERNTCIDVRDDGSYYVGEVDIPAEDGNVSVSAKGNTGAEALERAANVAQSIMDDPSVAPFVPPEARAAVAGARVLARAASSGFLSSLFNRLTGSNKRKLARVLLETTHGDHRDRGVGTLNIGTLNLGAGGITVGPGRGSSRPGTGRPGFVWVRDHWERKRNTAAQSPYPTGPGQYPADPYAYPPYYGYPPSDPYGYGLPYGGYPPQDPYYGYGPYAPVDPWAQYAAYGWGQAASPWGGIEATADMFGSQVLDQMWPELRAQSQGGGY